MFQDHIRPFLKIVIQYCQLTIRAGNILQLFRYIETPHSTKCPISILIIAMNMEKIIMHHTGMENPQVIIAFPVTVRTFHRQSPDLLSLSASGVLASVVSLWQFICWRFLLQEGSAERWLVCGVTQ